MPHGSFHILFGDFSLSIEKKIDDALVRFEMAFPRDKVHLEIRDAHLCECEKRQEKSIRVLLEVNVVSQPAQFQMKTEIVIQQKVTIIEPQGGSHTHHGRLQIRKVVASSSGQPCREPFKRPSELVKVHHISRSQIDDPGAAA